MVIDEVTKKVICLYFGTGKEHDFEIFKKSRLPLNRNIEVMADKGYIGLEKYHQKVEIPKKASKKHKLTKEEKARNREISRKRIVVENVICFLKHFKIISSKYRGKHKKFGLIVSLISSIYNKNFIK